MNADPNAWQRLAADARSARKNAPAADDGAPFGFASRVVAMARELRERESRLALWARVAWRAAFASLALCGIAFVAETRVASSQPLISPPALPLPGLDGSLQ